YLTGRMRPPTDGRDIAEIGKAARLTLVEGINHDDRSPRTFGLQDFSAAPFASGILVSHYGNQRTRPEDTLVDFIGKTSSWRDVFRVVPRFDGASGEIREQLVHGAQLLAHREMIRLPRQIALRMAHEEFKRGLRLHCRHARRAPAQEFEGSDRNMKEECLFATLLREHI